MGRSSSLVPNQMQFIPFKNKNKRLLKSNEKHKNALEIQTPVLEIMKLRVLDSYLILLTFKSIIFTIFINPLMPSGKLKGHRQTVQT